MTPRLRAGSRNAGDLEAATDYGLREGWRKGLVRPRDVGGTNSSHHGATLRKLAKREFAEQGEHGLIAMNHLPTHDTAVVITNVSCTASTAGADCVASIDWSPEGPHSRAVDRTMGRFPSPISAL